MIIGLTGSFGAGKGAVVEYLVQKGFKYYSATEFIKEEIARRGMPPNRDSMIVVANDMRAKNGPAYIVESLYGRAKSYGGDAVIEALRALAEVREIKKLGVIVIGVDADPEIRYTRAYARGEEKDNVSFEKFLAQEREESNPDNPAKQDIFGALKESDAVVQNNGTLEELRVQVDRILTMFRK